MEKFINDSLDLYYRCSDNGTENFYRFPSIKEVSLNKMLQPLEGLKPEAVSEAFKDLNVSEEFKKAVILNAEIN